jgi:hypothetical protein
MYSDRQDTSLDMLIPADPNTPYDMHEVIKRVIDEENFFELMPDFARNIIIGIALTIYTTSCCCLFQMVTLMSMSMSMMK